MPKPEPFLFPDKTDLLSAKGASLLCACIMSVWAKRGYAVTAERFEVAAGTWGVRSNLVAGLPARWRRGAQ